MAERKPVPDATDAEWERFWGQVRNYGKPGCWTWIGGRFTAGYGAFVLRGETRRAHRVAYVWTYGEPGLDLDHLCRNRACVNPDHLSPATPRQNIIERGFSPAALNARKTHCDHGHEFTADNTVIDSGGWRQCRTCLNQRAREYVERNRDEVNRRKRERRERVSYDPRPCEECGGLFTPKRSDGRFCSSPCQQRSARRARLGRA